MSKDYYLGLDIGTDSVGWSVANTDYTIPKFNGKSMWGIRLFEKSNTAEERRGYRCARRRTQRSRERLDYLEMLFDEEISKVDVAFFQRLKDSSLYLEDKSVSGKYCVFNDENFTDKDFHKKYPTIYHLRRELICSKEPKDVRLVFLALHHIIKNRGHFLFDLSSDGAGDFAAAFNALCNYLYDNYEIELNCSDTDALKSILKNNHLGKIKKKTQIIELLDLNKKSQEAHILSLLSGASEKLSDVYDDETLKNVEKKSITLSGNFDDTASEYEAILGERFELIELLKAIYDWAVLADILDGEEYISYAKVNVYEKHKTDLTTLKEYVRKYTPEKYGEIFKLSRKNLDNYVAYSGHMKHNGRTAVLEASCTQEDFCTYIRKTLGKCADEKYVDMFSELELCTFMPKQVNKNNSVIPMQIHRAELVAILDNAKNYLAFLNDKDENGISVYEKIISIFDYRIPYYVGPLNNHSGKYWVVRKEGKIYPWNIKNIVDYDKSAEAFIENLTSKCSYLPDCDVIPKNSLLYSKFMVLNELNNLKIDGRDIPVSLKQSIYTDLFEKYRKVTMSTLKRYLTSMGVEFEDISGIDGDFKSSLKPAIELKDFNLCIDEKEEIIKAITIFGDDKKLLKKRLTKLFADKLSEDEIKKISKQKFTGWSNLSREFLTQICCVHKASGEVMNIITAMWETNNNLMQLIYSEDFTDINDEHKTFIDVVNSRNIFDANKSLSDIVDELYVSPKVKRPIYQSLLITKEIEKIQKCPPKKIFVEVARGEEKKERKASRKQNLLELYKTCKNEYAELYESLEGKTEDELRSDKLYLYYTQLGKCVYTGEKIQLEQLMGSNSIYDIDHIYPQSKLKDNSLDNRVLVKKIANEKKGDIYPISSDVQGKMRPLWKALLEKGFISKEKFKRLIRLTPLSDDELGAFINRQLVETRQSTKAVAQILKQLYPDTEIVYVKAALVSDFRHQYDMLKCREINDYHHAKDAYLNIVVGNVYNVRCTHNKGDFIKGLQMSGTRGYSMNRMFDFNVNGAWVKDNDKSITTVKNTMRKNNILYTRYAFEKKGGLFNQTIYKKGDGIIPTKSNSAIKDTLKYGGFKSPTATFYCCVEEGKPTKRSVRLIFISLYNVDEYLQNPIEYLVKNNNLVNPVIIVDKIKIQSCLSFDGYRLHLGGKNSGGAMIVYRSAVQLVLDYDTEKYIRNVIKYLDLYSSRPINNYDHITKAENEKVYKLIIDKLTNTIYSKMYYDLGIKLIDATDTFIGLSAEKQCAVLKNIFIILKNNATPGDLKLLNINSNGLIRLGNNITKYSSVKLINQSVTGLFENEVELLK